MAKKTNKKQVESGEAALKKGRDGVSERILTVGREVFNDIIKKAKKPSLRFPIRSLANVKYDPKTGYFEIRGKMATRTLSYNTVKTFAQSMRLLATTKKDLLDIIKEVDDKVVEIFKEAYLDTAREFETIFARLFPGGDGRLILTDPDNFMTTGVDVEARPPGKRVKRLSLLSGGERSLVAVAMLVAIFKARPSPFYVMDEVEAALDDTNLGRLLGVFEELREKSQLIITTHQKRTMEIADSLYGVTMRGDGVSEVISQRLRESESV